MAGGRGLFRSKFVRDTLILQASKLGVTALGLAAWAVVPVALGAERYGIWALAQSAFAIWLTFDLTGAAVGVHTRLAAAVGARDDAEILRLMAAYVQIMLLWALVSMAVLFAFAPALVARLYPEAVPLVEAGREALPALPTFAWASSAQIGWLAAWLSLSLLADPFYNLVVIALQSRRQMGALGLLQNANQLVLTLCLVGGALLNPTPETLVAARLLYSFSTLLLALAVYRQLRARGGVVYPALRAVLAAVPRASYRPYWRFGFANALDKNLANLYTQLPLQIVGVAAGTAAASYLQLALRGIQQAGLFTSAIFDNLQAVVPQAIGRGDYLRLWRNLRRVLLALAVGGGLFYGAVALFAPAVIVPLFGDEWLPALPLIPALAIYGVATTVGGVFGPLYRALDLMRAALLIKAGTLAVGLPLGALLVLAFGTLGGAWTVNILFVVSVLLTAAAALPALRSRAVAVDRQKEEPF